MSTRASRARGRVSLALPVSKSSSTGRVVWLASQRLLALLALLVVSPVLGLAWVAVRTTSRGPFLFRQMRPGRDGRHFAIYKIRTMRTDTEKQTALGVSKTNSSITPVGRLLRDLKLDELPQLWNIVRGDMEFVGPRPLPIALYEELAREIPGFHLRNSVRPGLTNVSQVAVVDNGVGDRLIDDWSLRFQGELHYIRNKSVAYDAVVIGMTALYILRKLVGRRGASDLLLEVPSGEGTIPATLIAGVPVANLGYDEVVGQIEGWIRKREQRYVCICPVHSIVEAAWNPAHRKALQNAAFNTADGVPVVWAQKLFGHREASRVYGPTLMLRALERAQEEGWRIALYGGHEDRLQELVQRLKRDFPRLQIVSAISPPFRALSPKEDDAIVEMLNRAEPDIVWVGLGCPKQEQWMLDHAERVRGVLVGVGAAFDFHAGAVRQAPPLLQRLGLEWLFRLACEPRRLFKRYATTNPAYIWMVLRQALGGLRRRLRYQCTIDLGSRRAHATFAQFPGGPVAAQEERT